MLKRNGTLDGRMSEIQFKKNVALKPFLRVNIIWTV